MDQHIWHTPEIKKKIIVTGGTGYLGKALVNTLSHEKNYEIRILTRNPNFDVDKFDNVELFIGDLLDINSFKNLLEEGAVVINLAYISGINSEDNIIAINNLLEACATAKILKLIHCSTAVVVGDCSKKIINEEEPNNPLSNYSFLKLKIEDLIKAKKNRSFEAIILRPSAIFGNESINLRKLADDILKQRVITNYIRLCLFNYRRLNLVHISNVVAAFMYFINEKKCYNNEVFLLSDSESENNNFIQVQNLIVRKAGLFNFYKFFIPFPLIILKVILSIKKSDFISPVSDFSSEKIKNIGYKKVTSFENALDDYVENLLSKDIC